MDFNQIANNFGVPVGILAVVALGLWRIGAWLARKVVEPIVSSHVDLIKALQTSVPDQGAKLDKLIASSDKHTVELTRVRETLQQQTGVLGSKIDTQTRVISTNQEQR